MSAQHMEQIVAAFLFFYVFGLLAVALTIYLAVTLYRFFKKDKKDKNE